MTVISPQAEGTTRQRSAPYVVVSCDTHVGPRLVEDLRPYCPKDLLEAFDAYAEEMQQRREAAAAAKQRVSFGGQKMGDDWGVRLDNLQTPGHHDIHARLRDLDSDGVAAEVMFHDSQNGEPIPFQTDTLLMRGAGIEQDFDLLRAGQRIYNQWLADACSVEPERHIGLMHLPMWDLDAAIEELEWARSVGLKGINFPTPKPYLEPYNSPNWDRFFSACEDLGVTLCNHGGAGASGGTFPGAMSIAKFEISMMARICPMDQLVFGGVFERHPRLRLVLTESPGTWWNFVLKEMDSIYLTDTRSYGPAERERVPRLPSEYAAEQVFIGASFHARFEAEDAIANGYEDRVIWGSDYPHFEGTYQYGATGPNGEPMTWASWRFHYAGLPDGSVRRFLGGNAMTAYDLDLSALTKVAARINAPTFEDLNSEPVSERPPGSGHLAFRTFGFWA
ncbi:MAG TPA: amidohydrolase family protein [Acidimicrobiales bacterium]|nr:amidohydrolase family protein [Acidimicrobiales bacterium]